MADPSVRPESRRTRGAVFVLIALIAAAFVVLAAIGATQDARGERVLSILDPLIGWIRALGPQSMRWLLERRFDIAWLVTGAASFLTLVTLVRRGRAPGTVLLAVAAAAATWGQVLTFDDHLTAGAFLYGLGMSCGFALGLLHPLANLQGFPVLREPAPARSWRRRVPPENQTRLPEPSTRTTPAWVNSVGWEFSLVFLLTAVGLLLRTYALNELPAGFDSETVSSMIESRTAWGIRRYFDSSFLTTAPGMIHILTQRATFALFGTSPYSVRLASLVWGVAAVPLFYWLIRRIAGRAPAIFMTAIFVAAPEQLYWSRTENAFFGPVSVLAIISAHLGLWMVEQLSFRAALAAALWMPVCRYFYIPSFVLFVYPLALFAHALLFVRRAWRKAWYVAPLLAAGAGLWYYGLSIIRTALNGWRWQFVNPTIVYGAAPWQKHGEDAFREADLPQLLRLQLDLLGTNLGDLVHGLVVNAPHMFSHWINRSHFFPQHAMLLNVALTVVFLVGLGYLLGQLNERRCFALLCWLVLGLLPAAMSNEASARRIVLVFPAIYAVVGVMLAASVRVIRLEMGRWWARVAAGLLTPMVLTIIWAGLASHFLLYRAPLSSGEPIRFVQPLFEASDAIFSNLEERRSRLTQVFGNLDRFLERRPCYEYVPPRKWLQIALDPECSFNDEVYPMTMSREGTEDLRRSYDPQRVSYVLEQTLSGRDLTALLQELYPSAAVRTLPSVEDRIAIVSLTVDIADIRALRSPELILSSDRSSHHGRPEDLENDLLAGVRLVSAADTSARVNTDSWAVVKGGILVDLDGWYGLGFEPTCEHARLTVDSQPVNDSAVHPLLAGIHSFELRLPGPGVCALPLQILVSPYDGGPALDTSRFVAPKLASLPSAKAPPVVSYPGEGLAERFVALQGSPDDIDSDAEGRLSVLFWESFRGWRVDRFDTSGQTLASWHPGLNSTSARLPMAVAPDGTHFFLSGTDVVITDGNGAKIGAWTMPLIEQGTDIAIWPGNRLLVVFPGRHSLALLTRDGQLLEEVKEFKGGPGRFGAPNSVTVRTDGYILVLQYDGWAFLFFQDPALPWSPELVRTFHVDFALPATESRGATFDGPNRILVPDRSSRTPLVYTLHGERMLAESPAEDLATRKFGTIAGFLSTDRFIYLIDQSYGAVLRIAR